MKNVSQRELRLIGSAKTNVAHLKAAIGKRLQIHSFIFTEQQVTIRLLDECRKLGAVIGPPSVLAIKRCGVVEQVKRSVFQHEDVENRSERPTVNRANSRLKLTFLFRRC